MKRLILAVVTAVAVSSAVHGQEVEPRVVSISAQQFGFTPSEITVKRGEVVTLRVTSADPIHRLVSKDLGFNVDIRPDQPRDITIAPDKAGRFVAICNSGRGTRKMVITVE
jgi:cytochrome c oxidase subunit II